MGKRGVLWITLGFIGSVAALGPLRAFPLDDDWSYALSVRHWMSAGRLWIPDFASPTLVGHTLWGGLFCLPFGFSFAALRISTLVLALMGLIVFYLILRRLSVSGGVAVAAVVLLFASPIFCLLSQTFMTDVPFFAWSLLACYFFLRGLQEKDGDGWLFAASLAALWAYLVRQVGLLIPIGMALQLARERRLGARRAFLLCGAPVIGCAIHQYWFRRIHGPTWASVHYDLFGTAGHLAQPAQFAIDVLLRGGASMLSLGFFLAPIAAAMYRRFDASRVIKSRWILPAALGLAFFVKIFGAMPYSQGGSGIMNRFGLGTITLEGVDGKAAGVFAVSWIWAGITAVAAFAAIVLADFFFRLRRKLPAELSRLAFPLLLPFVPYLFTLRFYDRYPLGPLAYCLLVGACLCSHGESSWRPLWMGCVAILSWSLCGTLDYLNWNQARWRAGVGATQLGVAPESVSNGAEWAGTYQFERGMAQVRRRKDLKDIEDDEWSRGFPINAKVTFSNLPPGREWKPAGVVRYPTPLSRSPAGIYLYIRE